MYNSHFTSVPNISDILRELETHHEDSFNICISIGTRYTNRGPGLFNNKNDRKISQSWNDLKYILINSGASVTEKEILRNKGKAYGGKYKNYDIVANAIIEDKYSFFKNFSALGKNVSINNLITLKNDSNGFYEKVKNHPLAKTSIQKIHSLFDSFENELTTCSKHGDTFGFIVSVKESDLSVSFRYDRQFSINFNNNGYENMRNNCQILGMAAVLLETAIDEIYKRASLQIIPWKNSINNLSYYGSFEIRVNKWTESAPLKAW